MKVTPTSLPGVLLIEPDVFTDARGEFLETHHSARYAEHGIPGPFVQDNLSRSVKGTLRGLHYQLKHAQGKLVMALTGRIFDVAVDIRKNSPAFGRWVGVELSGENRRQLYIPPGFAHGFCVVSETADVLYKCTDLYAPRDERGIVWNDPALAIAWPVTSPLLSNKDRAYPRLAGMDKDLPAYRASRAGRSRARKPR
jgi:dTDP-4-dehydrorhamnose 3,5-epimerase